MAEAGVEANKRSCIGAAVKMTENRRVFQHAAALDQHGFAWTDLASPFCGLAAFVLVYRRLPPLLHF